MNVTRGFHGFPSTAFTAVEKRRVIYMKNEYNVGGKKVVALATAPDEDLAI